MLLSHRRPPYVDAGTSAAESWVSWRPEGLAALSDERFDVVIAIGYANEERIKAGIGSLR